MFPTVLDQINDHDMKISDLQETLDQALDYARQTEDINEENTAKFQDYKVCTVWMLLCVWAICFH